MLTIIFTDNKIIEKFFSSIKAPKGYMLEHKTSSELKKSFKDINKNSFTYIDISSLDKTTLTKILSALNKQKIHYGIIDPKGTIKDIAELFHNGASDYIGKDLLKNKLSPKRFEAGTKFLYEETIEEEPKVENKTKYLLSGNDWKNIKSGQEYTFCMMFIEIDNTKEIKKLYGENHFSKFTQCFQNYLDKTLNQSNGKIWMWMDNGGLILFPFDGKNCEAIIAAIRLILNRTIICIEDMDSDFIFSYRIAIHVGNTQYKSRGSTGNIISDSINSIFHLGQKFAEKGCFYVTQDAWDFVPEKIKKYFIKSGPYEGREQYKLKNIS